MKKCLLFLLVFFVSCSSSINNEDISWQPSKKLWLHRVNDTTKAQFFQYKYSGFEVDIQYIDTLGTFVVAHDVDKQFTLTLEKWVSAIQNIDSLGLWLDFRNLSGAICNRAANELVRIFKNRTQLTIVESFNPKDLAPFSLNGFVTSYYIPYFEPHTTDTLKLNAVIKEISKALEYQCVNCVSGYAHQYDLLRNYFPNVPKLLWYVQTDVESRNYYENLVSNDETVKVLLVYDDINR